MKSMPLDKPTRRIGAPLGWDHEKQGICHTIEVLDKDGVMYTAWQPSLEEIELIKAGHPIYLGIQGCIHPVVMLFVPK